MASRIAALSASDSIIVAACHLPQVLPDAVDVVPRFIFFSKVVHLVPDTMGVAKSA